MTITVTSLTATPTFRGNKLAATIASRDSPGAPISSGLAYLTIDTVEFYASTTNDFTTATKVVEGNPEALHAGLIEEQTYFYWAKARTKSASYGDVYPISPTAGVPCISIGTSGLAFGLANGRLVASVAGNALTIAIKTAAGNDPSASDPVYIAFPGATLTSGTYATRAITAAISLTISSGSTLAFVSNQPSRLWAAIFDDGGTLRLAARNCSRGYDVLPFAENVLASATAEGGVGGADSAGVFYASQAITSKSFRAIGYLEWISGLATAGTWNAAPSIIRLRSQGTRLPGDVVQSTFASTGAYSSGGFNIPFDNTAPRADDGGYPITSNVLTPTSAANLLDIEFTSSLSSSVDGPLIAALILDGTQECLMCSVGYSVANKPITLPGRYLALAGNTSEQTYYVYLGSPAASTLYVSGNSGGLMFNSRLFNTMKTSEIMV